MIKSTIKIIVSCLIFSLSACSVNQKPLNDTPLNPPPPRKIEDVNVALVLGGGGVKGYAHLGVLKILEENNIPIDLIVASSAGSAIGALYADDPNIGRLKYKLSKVNKWDILDISIKDSLLMLTQLKGPIRGIMYERFIENSLDTKQIEDLKIPLVVVTTDIYTNQLFNLSSGPIAPAVHASSALPPFFSPVKLYGKTLVDGGVKAPVPVEVAKTYNPKLTIAVDIGEPPPNEGVDNMLGLTYRAIWIFYYELARKQAQSADIEIYPQLKGYGTFDDEKKEEIYLSGINAARKAMPRLKQMLENRGILLKPN